ncbi:MAG: NAD(P)-dependent oxidoreductase, partial [Verrucomicrobia bacterium]|nr:NAD(P)-dependent oxidoreductase [Verrucomicrobiota bacterium]
MNPNGYQQLLVTGGGGYVGSALVPALLDAGYRVRVLDTFWYGKHVFGDYAKRPELELVELDLRDSKRVGE